MAARTAPDLAIIDCRIRTLDSHRPAAAAVACRDGRIVAVGTTAEVRAECDARTELIDGRGMCLVPGLTDAHQHPLYGLEMMRGADLTAVETPDELVAALARERETAGPERWVLGGGLHYEAFPDNQVSNRLIEQAVGGQPAMVRIFDGHTAVATRRALELAGITEATEFDDGSIIVFETGELRELEAQEVVQGAVPPATDAEVVERTIELFRNLNAVGLTCVHGMDDEGGPVDLARRLEESDQLTVRLVIPTWVQPGQDAQQRRQQLATRDVHGRLWRQGTAKFFADGVIDNHTGWLLAPDLNGSGTEPPVWTDWSEYREAVRLFAQAGFQCQTHAIGDRAVREVLDAYAAAGAAPGVRHRIEHIEQLDDADVARFAALGVVASMQPLHMQWRTDDGSDWWSAALGPERTARGWRCGDLARAGALVPLGSDWPVAGYDPREGMAWARLRRTPKTDRRPFEPEQHLSGLQALAGYTSLAALAAGDQTVAGRIAAGLRADFTAFAEDPADCPADDLVDLPVRLTVVDGRVVYRN